MPRYGKDLFNGARYGAYDKSIPNLKKTIRGIPLGFLIRRTIGRKNFAGVLDGSNAIIFRVRRGNGYYGAAYGVLYQDKYKYYAPWPNGNPAAAAARAALAQAVHNWKNVLDETTKQEYHKAAVKRGKMSGYNLYVGEYVKANA